MHLAPLDAKSTDHRQKEVIVERRTVNPWSWQDSFGFSRAIGVSGAQRTIFCAGQASTDDEGKPVHLNDMRGQIDQAMDNLETVLRESGAGLSDVVRLNYYTTDVDLLLEAYDALLDRLGEAGCQPASTLVGVASLAFPELLVEIEATAIA
jgi:enamine deaminase RidA (YjgF/YER057c/UK114 family)